MASVFKKLFFHPLALNLDINDENAIMVHREILQSKKLLRLVYDKWNRELMRGLEPTRHLEGLPMVELGAGPSFLERYIPGVIKTDCVPNPNCSQVVDGEAMPFPDNSVRLFFLTTVMHHMHKPANFFKEAERCLAPGGRVVLIEMANSPLGRLVTRLLNPYEFYDTSIKEWENSSEGRMTNANLALPWVIFIRDRKLYDASFPSLPVREMRRHTILAYYASGGLIYRSPLPDMLASPVLRCEDILSSLLPSLCVMMTIQLEKTSA